MENDLEKYCIQNLLKNKSTKIFEISKILIFQPSSKVRKCRRQIQLIIRYHNNKKYFKTLASNKNLI